MTQGKRIALAAGILVAVLVFLGILNNGFYGNSLPEGMGVGGMMVPEEMKAVPRQAESTVADASQMGLTRQVIKTAYISLVSKDVRKSVADIGAYAESVGGSVASSSFTGSEDEPMGTVVVRVPAEKLDAARAEIAKLGVRVISESINADDVTEQYVDLSARLKSMQASEAQFMEIMKRAAKVEDVLAVQRELERVRADIESLTSSIQLIEKQAKLSTIRVNVSANEEDLPVVDPSERWRPALIFKMAAGQLVKLAMSLGYIVIWLVVFIPLWALIALVVYLVFRFRKKKAAPLL